MKTEWPSDTRLLELREQGLVPYSLFATSSFVALCLLILLYALRSDFTDLVSAVSVLWQESWSEPGFLLTDSAPSTAPFLRLFILPPVVALSAAFVATFLQTKFLISPANLGIDTSRLAPFAPRASNNGLFFALLFILSSIIGLLAGISLLYLKLPPVLELLNNDHAYFINWASNFFPWLLPFLLVVLFFTGMLYLFMERSAFLYRHRMSRKELLEESSRNN